MQAGDVVRVLGPIDILTPEGALAVGGSHARALLGALAIGANHAVSIDHLQQDIWGDEPPDSVDESLQSYVSHLRQLLGADAIVHTDHSYELVACDENIDALRFELLVADALDAREAPERCRDICREALGLWRGRPFGDLADNEGFRLEAYRLDELRLVVMELALASELALGHHELAVAEIHSAVEEHPYREHLWYLLIEALAKCDRRVEALRAADRFRRELAEVGVEPGGELESIEQDLLAARHPSFEREDSAIRAGTRGSPATS